MRVTLWLALVPLVFGVWCLLIAGFDNFRLASAAGTIIGLALAIAIWRKYVRWAVLRSLSTTGLVVFTLAQVLIWHPLWAIGGCNMDDILCTAQSLVTLGLGLALTILVWWGGLLRRADHARRPQTDFRRRLMTPNAVRLAIGIALVPFLPGLFVMIVLGLGSFGGSRWSDEMRLFAAYELCVVIAILVWFLLWRRAAEWTPARRIVTITLALTLLGSPLSVFWEISRSSRPFVEMWNAFCYLAPVFAWALWLTGTAWAWRAYRSQALPQSAPSAPSTALAVCPGCGYSLQGLQEVRCPECGWKSTVDDIVERSLQRVLAVP